MHLESRSYKRPFLLKAGRHEHISHSLGETNEKLVDASQNGSSVNCLDYSPFTICFYYNVNTK